MSSVLNIENNTWGISLAGYGVIAEGVALLRQSINIILRTSKGSDPLRPEFGSEVYKWNDAPLLVAIPNVKKAILDALEMWEPRISVTSIRHAIKEPQTPAFEIVYSVIDDDIIDKILFDLKQGVTSIGNNEIILQAYFPPNPNGYRYQLRLIRNTAQVRPLPDPSGFTSINELFEWARSNWFFWGRWFLLSDRIACYMNSEGVTDATLSISVLPLVKIETTFPPIEPLKYYKTTFKVSGSDAVPMMPETYSTPGEVLFFAQANWNAWGNWYIEGFKSSGDAMFSEEFSSEFDVVPPDGFKLILVSDIEGFSADLNITIA